MDFLTLKPAPAESAGTAGQSESAGTAGELTSPPTKSKVTNNNRSALSASSVYHGYISTEWGLSYTHSTRLMKPTSNNSSSESLQWLFNRPYSSAEGGEMDRVLQDQLVDECIEEEPCLGALIGTSGSSYPTEQPSLNLLGIEDHTSLLCK